MKQPSAYPLGGHADGCVFHQSYNTDMLDLNLPKHSYVFLRKHLEEGVYQVSAVSASDVLKRNTDSLRCAVEHDVMACLLVGFTTSATVTMPMSLPAAAKNSGVLP